MYVEFGMRASNVGTNDEDLLPAAIVPIVKLGIQQFDEENSLTVDVARVNPKRWSQKTKRTKRRGKKK